MDEPSKTTRLTILLSRDRDYPDWFPCGLPQFRRRNQSPSWNMPRPLPRRTRQSDRHSKLKNYCDWLPSRQIIQVFTLQPMKWHFRTRLWNWICFLCRKRPLPDLRHCRRLTEEREGSHDKLCQNILCSDKDSKRVPPEYGSETLSLEINCSVSTCGPILGWLNYGGWAMTKEK
jgi:hypothetical protein